MENPPDEKKAEETPPQEAPPSGAPSPESPGQITPAQLKAHRAAGSATVPAPGARPVKVPRVSTGIPFLDQLLGGGFPAKSVVCFRMDPSVGADVFLYQFAVARRCHYVTPGKRADDIQRTMSDFGMDPANVSFVTGDEAKYLLPRQLQKVREERDANLVLDPFSFYVDAARNPEKVRKLLELLRDVVTQTGGVVLLALFTGTHRKEMENVVLNFCDAIVEVESHTAGEREETVLSIPKIRGTTPLSRVKVVIGEKIKIDTSREIA
jgi:KaiC/GvpD/RAD55 family RecA-like ATPase